MKILAINPGSTSTKIGIYEDETLLLEKTIRHPNEELEKFESIIEQYEFRKNIIVDTLKEVGLTVDELDAVVGRGGLLKPLEGGTYLVDDNMLKDLKSCEFGEHASNLGGLIAHAIATSVNKNAYIVDPVVVDELNPYARIGGHPKLQKKSIFHALNQKAIARQYASEVGKAYEELNLVVAHMGGGVSVGAHCKGKVVDVNNALDGEGPLSPERSGTMPAGDLARLCYTGVSLKEVMSMIKGKGGLVAHVNSNDVRELRASSDEYTQTVLTAMAYQIAKEIGAKAVVLDGKVDAILLTGGIAYDKILTAYIKEKVSFIAPVLVYAGEDELKALAQGGLRVLTNKETHKIY